MCKFAGCLNHGIVGLTFSNHEVPGLKNGPGLQHLVLIT